MDLQLNGSGTISTQQDFEALESVRATSEESRLV
ncbi:hypothetical protein A2U01_0069403, partial [Trifolium medium]|nr:hypothetical protein [Trifolium medium]